MNALNRTLAASGLSALIFVSGCQSILPERQPRDSKDNVTFSVRSMNAPSQQSRLQESIATDAQPRPAITTPYEAPSLSRQPLASASNTGTSNTATSNTATSRATSPIRAVPVTTAPQSRSQSQSQSQFQQQAPQPTAALRRTAPEQPRAQQNNANNSTGNSAQNYLAQSQFQTNNLAASNNAERFSAPEKRFDVSVNQLPVASLLGSLAQDSDYSIIVHPSIDDTISLNLKQVTLEEVLGALRDIYDYHIKREGNIYNVLPPQLVTVSIPVNYLMLQRSGLTSLSVSSGAASINDDGVSSGLSGGSNVRTENSTNFWDSLQLTLEKIIGLSDDSDEGNAQNTQNSSESNNSRGNNATRMVSVSPQASLVTVRAMPSEINHVREFLASAENNLQRQVILEARVVEVTLNDGFQRGIEWQRILGAYNDLGFNLISEASLPGNAISNTLDGFSAFSFGNLGAGGGVISDFAGVLNLLETQGDVQVLSSPRVTAINNQKSVIKIGDDEYFVTGVTVERQEIGDSFVSIPTFITEPFFSGIALDVTPQIDANNQVILHIKPSVMNTIDNPKVVQFGESFTTLPTAKSSVRETDTIVKAQNNEIIVIGGLMQTSLIENVTRTPVLGSIPVLGGLFSNKQTQELKQELVILLRPIIVENNQWQPHFRQTNDRWF